MDLDERIGYKFPYVTMKDRTSDDARPLFEVATGKRDTREGYEILKGFPIVTKWYELIAEANGLPPQHPLVHEAYWIGSSLLERNYNFSEIHGYIARKFKIEIPPPNNIPPHHNLHVNTYGLVSKPGFSEEERAACKVVPARISEDGNAESLVDLKIYTPENPFEYRLEDGLPVAIHRNTICAVLDENAADSLIEYGFERQQR